MRERVRVYWELGFLRVFLCTIVSPYFIVKSLQLRGRRQITESRKYCLVRVIVFFFACVFSTCFVSHRLEFWLNSLQKGENILFFWIYLWRPLLEIYVIYNIRVCSSFF